ncbi:MAG TPA: M15 family metallopeptidase [Acidimicrobiales bacterium]
MKARIVGIATVVVVIVSGVVLWLTWDSTQTPRSDTMPGPMSLQAPSALGGSEASDVGDVGDASEDEAPRVEPCARGDEPVRRDPLLEWDTVVVDPTYRLPADFEPPDLVDVSAAGFEPTGDRVRRGVIGDLTALRRAAEANGTPFIVVSAFRSYEHQRRLYEQQVAEAGRDTADARTARAGHSEHQLGTTIDVLDPNSTELTTAFADTPAGRWLAAHAHEYGFVLSYPDEGRERTCYDYEPWHLRYVGRETARRIHDSGLVPREWMLSRPRTVR